MWSGMIKLDRVAQLAADPPKWNLGTIQNPSICNTPLYIATTFDQIRGRGIFQGHVAKCPGILSFKLIIIIFTLCCIWIYSGCFSDLT